MTDLTPKVAPKVAGRESLEKLAVDVGNSLHPHIHVEESAVRPADAIVEATAHIKANLIVIGSHGNTGLTRILLGSTAERVVREATCDVLIIKPHL